MKSLTCPGCTPSPEGDHELGCLFLAALEMGVPWWLAIEAVSSAALDEESDVATRSPNEAPAAVDAPGGMTKNTGGS